MKLGVCYYPEHWPEEIWADDAARMKALGLTTVRIGEFAWSRIEPEPGRFEWEWLDRAVDTLSGAGMQIIMGTPTATPPKWLIDAYPDVLAKDAHGRVRNFGSRRHYSFSSTTYRRESARIVEAMAQRYGLHPGIVMWQTDNEYGCHDTVESNDDDARAGFRVWLKERYGDVGSLNTAWGTVFWSQEYRSFDEIDPPLATVTEPTPAHVMDWRRFSSDQVAVYNQMQVDVLRQNIGAVDTTHNFMGHFTEFDHYPVAAQVNVSTWDSYPLGFLEMAWWDDQTKLNHMRTGHPDFAAFHHDLYRGMARAGRFGVMEQQPGPVNWAGFNPAPLDGMVRLWSLEAVAHGAELVSYFRWRQAPFAQEQMHAGLNRPDNVADQAYHEAAQVAEDLAALGDIGNAEQADIALVYDYEAHWAHEIQPQGRNFRHDRLTFSFYSALRRLGVNVDVISQHHALDGYKLVLVPSSPMISESFVERAKKSDAHIVAGPRTGSRTENFAIPEALAPGPLQTLMGIKVALAESLRAGAEHAPSGGDDIIWREFIKTDLTPLEVSSDGNGTVWQNADLTYLSAWPTEETLIGLVSDLYDGTPIVSKPIEGGLRIRRRGGYIYCLNYGPEAASLDSVLDGSLAGRYVLGSSLLKAGELAVLTAK